MPHYSTYPKVDIPEIPFHEMILNAIEENIQKGSNKIALISGDNPNVKLTFEQLRHDSYSIATYLNSIGFKKDVAAIVLPNSFHYASFFLGCALNGGAISGASALFTDYELQRQFVDSNAKVVLTSEDLLPKVQKAVKQSPNIEKIIVVPKSSKCSLPSNAVSWDVVVSTNPRKLPKIDIDVHKDIITLPYSSGTTGSPKGVMLSHYNYSSAISIFKSLNEKGTLEVLDKNWRENKEKMLHFLPFYHIYGFALLCYGMYQGMTGIVLSRFEPNNFLKAIETHRIRVLSLVPPVVVFLAKHPICDKYDLSSVEFVMVGAAPAGHDLIAELQNRHKNIKYVQQGYGMTEASFGCHLPDLRNTQPTGSVGKLAPNLVMKIVDVSTGQEMEDGQRGEICLKGPTIMLGYFGKPEATASHIIDGWLHTGDIGYLDNEGQLFIVDRLKELIKVKGLQVPPAELEDLLLSHPKIRDCAVIGIPNEKTGELPKAFVVRLDKSLTEQEVKDFVKQKVSAYKRLEGGVEFLEEIPKSPSGKILRRLLRDQQKSKL